MSLFGKHVPAPRTGMPSPRLGEAEFKSRFKGQFQDPAFAPLAEELEKMASAAWDAYAASRKSPNTRKAGPNYVDPDYELALDWIAARDAIAAAHRRHEDGMQPPRILLINCSSRSEHTCPVEMGASPAEKIELEGWNYPRHLEGRLFSVVVHGDVEGAENVRRSISDWLRFMELRPAGPKAELDRYIGYWKPYATSHQDLDQDEAIHEEVRNQCLSS